MISFFLWILLYIFRLVSVRFCAAQEADDRDGAGNGKYSRPVALVKKLSKPHVFSVADRAFR